MQLLEKHESDLPRHQRTSTFCVMHSLWSQLYLICFVYQICERPYICKHCGKAFSQNGTLKRHSQTCKAAYSSINNNSVSNNKDFRFEQKFSISNDNNNILIMNSANHITDPMHLKPSNFPLLCAPIDELSDSEGQIKSPQTENTNPTIRNNTRLSSQYVCHEETEKQLNNMESSQIWMSTNSLKEEDEVSCLSNSLTSPIISNDKKRKCDSSRFYATVQRSDFSDQSINHFKQQQTENAGSTFNLKSQLSHWSDLDLSKLNNREIKQLLEKLHSIGKLYGCIDCQTFYLDEKMANFHLTKMHVKQLHSKTFQCFNCGTDLNNSLLFLKHFTHCLSSTKFNGMDLSIQSLTSVNSVSEITDSELIQNESENLKSLENHISEETINSCIDVPTEISDSTQKEITTTPINENNTSHSPFTGIKEQSEIQINGHNPEKKEADEETDRTSWSMGFPNSLDPRSTVKSVDSDTRE
ncbi:unnamed protein product [Heterobilharzia americana]|nr:unnamed protein product [Heterobilharzia americana]